MMHYPTVMRASIKEWHREANSLSLIRQVFFQVARTAKQGPGVSGPYIFGFFFLKWGKPFLKSYVHSRIMTKQMIMFVLMLTVWQEQSLFEKCKSFFFFFSSPHEHFEQKNLAPERMCQDPLTEAIIYIVQYAHIIKTLLSEIYTSAWKLSVSTRNEMLKKKKWYLLFKHCCFINTSSLSRIANLYL